MKFTKMHGLGNDFLVIDGEKELPEYASSLAVKWCNRYFGAGADGLVFILPSERADFQMRIFNSDGTEAEQCGNAIRCVCKYVYEKGYIDRRKVSIETLGAGVQLAELKTDSGAVSSVRIDMGEPILRGRAVPTTLEASPVLDWPLEVNGQRFRFTAVSMGNPTALFLSKMQLCLICISGGPCSRSILFSRKNKCRIRYSYGPGPRGNAGMGTGRRLDPGLWNRRLRYAGRLRSARIYRPRSLDRPRGR